MSEPLGPGAATLLQAWPRPRPRPLPAAACLGRGAGHREPRGVRGPGRLSGCSLEQAGRHHRLWRGRAQRPLGLGRVCRGGPQSPGSCVFSASRTPSPVRLCRNVLPLLLLSAPSFLLPLPQDRGRGKVVGRKPRCVWKFGALGPRMPGPTLAREGRGRRRRARLQASVPRGRCHGEGREARPCLSLPHARPCSAGRRRR